jgi:hypothetical protein
MIVGFDMSVRWKFTGMRTAKRRRDTQGQFARINSDAGYNPRR